MQDPLLWTMELLYAMCKVPIFVGYSAKINYCKFLEILATLGIWAITIILRNIVWELMATLDYHMAILCKHGPPSTNQKSINQP